MTRPHAWHLTLLACCLLGIGASLSFAGYLPGDGAAFLRPVCAAPLLMALAAMPILAIASPVEPSLLKFVVLSGLLSPCWIAAWFLLGRTFLATDGALALAFAATALSAPLAARRRVAFQPLGKAAWLTLVLTAVLVAGLAGLLSGVEAGNRLLQPGVVWHAGVAQALERGLPENPWLAGTALPTNPAYALLGLLFARCLALAEPAALAAMNVWSIALLPVLLYLWAAPVWREPRRVLATPVLALLCWNALGGLLPWGELGGGATWAGWLAHGTPGAGEGGVLYGLAGWMSPAPWIPALTFTAGAWMCAAHALRHAQRPWVGLCALLHGAAALIDPTLGAAGMAATLATAILAPGRPSVRPVVSLALLFAALPAFALARTFSAWSEPAVGLGDWPGPLAVLLPGALLIAMAAGLVAGRVRGAGRLLSREDRTLLVLPCLAVAAMLCAPFTHLHNHLRSAEFARAASLPLALIAAGGLFEWIDRSGWRRVFGWTLGVAALVGGARGVHHVSTGFLALASSSSEEPEDNSTRNLKLCYAWIRDAPELRGGRPILVREVASGRDRIAGDFTPHPAVLYTDLPMWCDLHPELAPTSTRWEQRSAQVQALFNQREGWTPPAVTEWDRLGRSAVFVVEELDRRRTHRGDFDEPARGVELRLRRLGARLVKRFGDAAVYVLGD